MATYREQLEDAYGTRSTVFRVSNVLPVTKIRVARMNPRRTYIQVCTNGGAPINIGFSADVSFNAPTIGVRLVQFGTIDWNLRDVGDLIFNELWASISFAGTFNITVQETEYVYAGHGNRIADQSDAFDIRDSRRRVTNSWTRFKESLAGAGFIQ